MTVSTLTRALSLTLVFLLTGCQLPYLVSGAFEQVKILNSRQKIEKAIENVATPDQIKDKLRFALKAKSFASNNGLTCKNNFETYVKLKRPYVSYLLIASKKYEIKAKTWWFPVVGSFPYKGYFSEEKAQIAAKNLQHKDYDTYVRGVTAYSSLGWFKEPILSSMLQCNKYSTAKTIFHECFHTTFFIKNNTRANEQLAVFFAHHYMIKFLNFLKDFKEKDLQLKTWEDSKKFTKFLEHTILDSKKYYRDQTDQKILFLKIKNDYISNLKPKLRVNNYDHVFLKNLNNAKLAAFNTYFHDFKNLEIKLQTQFNNEIKNFLDKLLEFKFPSKAYTSIF